MLTTLLPFVFLAAQEPVPPGQPEQLEELEPKTYEEAHYPLFGRQVSGVGDVDADGTPDILVADTGGWAEGHKGEVAGVFVLSGKDGSTLHAVFGRRPGEEFASGGHHRREFERCDIIPLPRIVARTCLEPFGDFRRAGIEAIELRHPCELSSAISAHCSLLFMYE